MTDQHPSNRQGCSVLFFQYYFNIYSNVQVKLAFQPLSLHHKEVIVFSCACVVALPLFSAAEQLSAAPTLL